MPRRPRLSPVPPKTLPSASRWRAKPVRNAADDDEWLEEWMIGFPSVAARTSS
ncbi:MAG: hypothetical protein JOZ55_00060 [Alphaproteobacteria bacterium]|nr:hypothetical protein [Alphaproteobacteria bacterium]